MIQHLRRGTPLLWLLAILLTACGGTTATRTPVSIPAPAATATATVMPTVSVRGEMEGPLISADGQAILQKYGFAPGT